MTDTRDLAEVAVENIEQKTYMTIIGDYDDWHKQAADIILEAYAKQAAVLTKLLTDKEHLLMRVREQTDYSQSVHKLIDEAVIKELRWFDVIPEGTDPCGRPIEQVVGGCLARLTGREKQQAAELAEQIERAETAEEEATMQAAELERLTAPLRTTVDGVFIVPLMEVWVIYQGKPLAVVVASVGYSIDLMADNPWGTGTVAPHEWFYSTREAAEAAGGK